MFDHWRQRLFLVAHVPASAGREEGIRAVEEMADRITASGILRPEPAAARTAPSSAPTASVGEAEFRDGVSRTREHILAGDIFQAVLSRRLSVPAPEASVTTSPASLTI